MNKIYFNKIKDFLDIHNLNSDILFIEKVDHSFIPNVLTDLNIIIFPACLPDAFPRSVMEAMAMEAMGMEARETNEK